jgi:hypothetical protein
MSIAMKDGLGMNTTLESLKFQEVRVSDNNVDLWCRALSFLHTNKALKFLVVGLHNDVEESCFSAFRIDIAAMLQENASLESFSIRNLYGRIETMEAEEYTALGTVLKHNTTLRILIF